MRTDYLGCDGRQILGQGEAIFHALDGFLARIPVGFRRKLQKTID